MLLNPRADGASAQCPPNPQASKHCSTSIVTCMHTRCLMLKVLVVVAVLVVELRWS